MSDNQALNDTVRWFQEVQRWEEEALAADLGKSTPAFQGLLKPDASSGWQPTRQQPFMRGKSSGGAVAPSASSVPYSTQLKEAMKSQRVRPSNRTASSSSPPVKGVEVSSFDTTIAFTLADGVDRSHQEGKLESGFSLRRRVMWAKAFKVLVEAGLGANDAFRLGFALCASERATPEERKFYEELWRVRMNASLYPLPTVPTPSDGQFWHPTAGLAGVLIEAGMPLWMHGDAGNGKTVIAEMVAASLSRPFIRFQGTRERTVDDMVGGWTYLPEKGTVFNYGVVPEGMRQGAVLALDEGSALPSEVTFEFHAALEGKPLVLLKHGGEKIFPAPGFAPVVCDNTVGLGERSEYVGTNPTNAAFRDRWLYLQVGAIPAEMQRRIVEAVLKP